jgi:TonB family protein
MQEFFSKHKKGILGTLIFHGILVVIFLFSGFSTPLPLPAEQGILINFGNTPDASGNTELQMSSPQQETTQQESQVNQRQQERTTNQQQPASPQNETSSQEGEEVATQDFEEAPSINQQKKENQQQQERQEEQIQDQQQQKEKEAKETKPERQVNEKALYPGKSEEESGETEGETQGRGNQGRQSGSPLSDNHANVDSRGMGGIDFSLQGRNPESLPKPSYNYQVEGKVVVEITVDKYGNVTKAVPGVKGSTTLNDKLLDAAKRAALSAKFDRKPDAPAYQKGTITYYFRLQ